MKYQDLEKLEIRSMRKAYGEALEQIGILNKNIVVVEADVSSSTMTSIFAQKFPDRFYNVGIAEESMVDIAAGLALGGQIPFANSFASLICYRALEQIRTCIAYNNVNVKIASSYAGVSDFKDGPTHHTIFDLAVMRAMPNMTVLVPADSVEAVKMVHLASEFEGPVYLRLTRDDIPTIFDENHEVIIGKGSTIKNGKDLTIICMGTPIYRTLKAASILEKEGLSVRIINISTLKPLDKEIIIKASEETGAIVTVEEHNIIGGLFSAISEVITQNKLVPVIPVGINDIYARTAKSVDILFDHVGLTVENILNASKKVIENK
jgi:transketolase